MSEGTPQQTRETADALKHLLADSYTLYLKTHNFHWNVTGPMFSTLHTLFEQQYMELATAVDEIAERIRALGHPAPGSYTEFAKLAGVKEARGVPKAIDMIRELAADLDAVVASAKHVFESAEKAGDQASADLATRRMDASEKSGWMLRSHLE